MNDTPTIADLKAKQQRHNDLTRQIVQKRRADPQADINGTSTFRT